MYLAWVRVADAVLQQWRAIQRLMVPRPVGFVLAPAHQPDRQLEEKGPLVVNDSYKLCKAIEQHNLRRLGSRK